MMSTGADFEVSVLTPAGRGAVAVIAVAGTGTTAALGQYFRSSSDFSPARLDVDRIYYGRWHDQQGEEIVVCRCDDQEFEVHCHGGSAAVDRIVEDLCRAGGTRVASNAWLARDAANLIEQDARIALAAARTERCAAILLDQWQGALVRAIHEVLADCASGQAPAAVAKLRMLAGRGNVGRHLVMPFEVVLAGLPNVGKSSLINALVGYDRAIVYDAPGTTRDIVTAETAIDGWPVTLSDTAGLRASCDAIEAAGVRGAQSRLQSADLVVLVFEAHRPALEEEQRLQSQFPAALVVANKCDLVTESPQSIPTQHLPGDPLRTSAITGEGIAELLTAISRCLVPDPPEPGAAMPFRTAQIQALERAITALDEGNILLAGEVLMPLVTRPANIARGMR